MDDVSATPHLIPDNPRVAVVGDSVIAGYGVDGNSYAQMIADRLGADRTMFYARSTFTVVDAVRMLPRIVAFAPDLVLVNVGGSDGLVHAGETVERFLTRFAPKSWQGIGGLELDPRAPEPTNPSLRTRLTTVVKLAVKHVGIRLTGGYRRVAPERFAPLFDELIRTLCATSARVVVVGLHSADERLWPRSNASGLEYEVITLQTLRNYDVLFADPKPVLHQWSDFLVDHAHFDISGHRKVADLLWSQLEDERAAAGHCPLGDALPGTG